MTGRKVLLVWKDRDTCLECDDRRHVGPLPPPSPPPPRLSPTGGHFRQECSAGLTKGEGRKSKKEISLVPALESAARKPSVPHGWQNE